MMVMSQSSKLRIYEPVIEEETLNLAKLSVYIVRL